jgi:hypothetical protein
MAAPYRRKDFAAPQRAGERWAAENEKGGSAEPPLVNAGRLR